MDGPPVNACGAFGEIQGSFEFAPQVRGAPLRMTAIPLDGFCPLALEVQPQGKLAGAVAGVLGDRGGGELAEGGGVVDLRRRWGEVGVVEDVGEGGFKANPPTLSDNEDLGEAPATTIVPGASRLPTLALPIRPAPAGVCANAAMLK